MPGADEGKMAAERRGGRRRPGLALALALGASLLAWAGIVGAGMLVVRHERLIAERLGTLAGAGADLLLRTSFPLRSLPAPSRERPGKQVSMLG